MLLAPITERQGPQPEALLNDPQQGLVTDDTLGLAWRWGAHGETRTAGTRKPICEKSSSGFALARTSDTRGGGTCSSPAATNAPALIVTSSKAFPAWGEIFGDDVVAAATIDGSPTTLKSSPLNGDSYRLKDGDLGLPDPT